MEVGAQLHVGVADDFAPAVKAHPALRIATVARLEMLGAGGLPAWITAQNTLIGSNEFSSGISHSADDCFGGLGSLGHNLIQTTNNCAIGGNTTGNVTGADPLLGPLQNNGGSTPTHALLSGSPAIDAGDNSSCASADERGAPRPFDGNGAGGAQCDIGAYEFGAKVDQTILFAPLTDRGLKQSPFTLNAAASSGLAVNYTASGPCSVSGSSITLNATGHCTVTAHQPGDGNYHAAPSVAQGFNILPPLFLPLILR